MLFRSGNAANLSSNASNTLNLIASTSGMMPAWQQTDLSVGPPVRSNYFQNPTTQFLSVMSTAANSIYVSANSANDSTTTAIAQSLMIEISSFQSHTNNVSGVTAVSNTYYPSLQSAQNLGQLNMMTLAKSDGVTNTAPILGSFTSLFIQDELSANANTLVYMAGEYANSLTLNVLSSSYRSEEHTSELQSH